MNIKIKKITKEFVNNILLVSETSETGYLKMEFEKDNVIITSGGTNGNVIVTEEFLDYDGEGTVQVNALKFANLVRDFIDGSIIIKDKGMMIEKGEARVRMSNVTFDTTNVYLTAPEKATPTIVLKFDDFKNIVSKVAYAAQRTTSLERIVTSCLVLKKVGEKMYFFSTDGFRAACIKRDAADADIRSGKDFELCLLRAHIERLVKLNFDNDMKIEIAHVNERRAILTCGHITMVFPVVDATSTVDIPSYMNRFLKASIKTKVNADKLREIVTIAGHLTSGEGNKEALELRYYAGNDYMNVSIDGAVGNFKDKLPISPMDVDVLKGFSCAFLAEAAKYWTNDSLVLLSEQENPMLIVNGQKEIHMLLPTRLKAKTEGKAA